jgi:hypothetical protein
LSGVTGTWQLDTNGNRVWNAGVDTQYSFGATGSLVVNGDWTGTGSKKIGTFQAGVWSLDANGNGTWDPPADIAWSFGGTTDLPVVGAWTGGAADKIGVYRTADRTFSLDTNGDGTWDTGDTAFTFDNTNVPSTDVLKPIAGKWTGGTVATVGLWDQTTGVLYLNTYGQQSWGGSSTPGVVINLALYSGSNYAPLAGDWNGDGITDFGVYSTNTHTFKLLRLHGSSVVSTETDTLWGSSTSDQPAVI